MSAAPADASDPRRVSIDPLVAADHPAASELLAQAAQAVLIDTTALMS